MIRPPWIAPKVLVSKSAASSQTSGRVVGARSTAEDDDAEVVVVLCPSCAAACDADAAR